MLTALLVSVHFDARADIPYTFQAFLFGDYGGILFSITPDFLSYSPIGSILIKAICSMADAMTDRSARFFGSDPSIDFIAQDVAPHTVIR